MLGQIKRSTIQGLRSAGALRAFAATGWRQQRLALLCWHGVSVSDEHVWSPGLYLSPERFSARLELLARMRCNVLPLGEALTKLRAGTLPPRSVVLTFDDGFADFASQAWPALKRYGFPATLYLTTHYVYNRFPIFNLVVPYMLWKCRDMRPGPNPELNWAGPQDLSTEAGRAEAWKLITELSLSKDLRTPEKDDLARAVARHLGFDYAALRRQRILELLSPREVTALSRDGLDIQLHTHRHRTPERMDRFAKELTDNRAGIEELTGRTPVHFCYPSGVQKKGMAAVLEEQGVVSATTCAPGLASRDSDMLRVPRFLDAESTPDLVVESWLSGVSQLLPGRAYDGMGDEYPYIHHEERPAAARAVGA